MTAHLAAPLNRGGASTGAGTGGGAVCRWTLGTELTLVIFLLLLVSIFTLAFYSISYNQKCARARRTTAAAAAASPAARLTRVLASFHPRPRACRYTDQSVAALAFQVGQMMVRQQVRLFANIQNALANVEAMMRLQKLNASDPTQIFPVARALFGPLLRAAFFGCVPRPRRTPARQAAVLMLLACSCCTRARSSALSTAGDNNVYVSTRRRQNNSVPPEDFGDLTPFLVSAVPDPRTLRLLEGKFDASCGTLDTTCESATLMPTNMSTRTFNVSGTPWFTRVRAHPAAQ